MARKFDPSKYFNTYINQSDYNYEKGNRVIERPEDAINTKSRIELPQLPINLPKPTYTKDQVITTLMKSGNYDPSKDTGDFAETRKKNFINNVEYYFNNQDEYRKKFLQEQAKSKDNFISNAVKKIGNTGIGKFVDRIGDTAADTTTYGTQNYIKPRDTGNGITNVIADIIGTGAGMVVNPAGIGGSANKILRPIGNAAERSVSKVPLPRVADKLVPAAVRGAAEFGALGGMEGYANGEGFKNTAKSIGTNALSGVMFGAGTKAIGLGLPKLKSSEFKNSIYGSIMPLEQPKEVKLPKLDNSKKAELPQIKDIKPKSKIVSSSKDKSNFKESYDKLYTRIVDINNPIKKVGDKTYTLATNSKNVGGTVDYILKEGLVDRQGNKIGPSLKEVVKDIPKGKEDDFWEYILQRHNISRATNGKPIYSDFTPSMSAEKARYFENMNPTWKEKANNITGFIDKFMNEWGVNSGITDKELYSALRKQYPNYVPTNRHFSSLEQGSLLTNGRGFVEQSNPMRKATGSDRNITDPIENIMNLVNRTVRTARYNEVGQSMLNEIRQNPEKIKGFAKIIPKGVPINSNVKNIVSVLEDGKPVNIQINDKSLLKALKKLNQSNSGDIEKAAKEVTNVFKSLITQKNPFFAVRNIARDIPTAYINGSENNPIKFGVDLLKAGKDLSINSPIAQKYKALGGGGSNFFNSDNVAKTAKELIKPPILKRVGNGIEKFNNLTESAPRLAEFKRVANKTGDMQKALYAANDVSTNFSRGGDITKSLDSFIPYLNAGVQGLDKLARQFKNKPISTVLKGATSITVPTLILNHVNKDNSKYKELDNRTKDNYYLIPNGDKFIKIPKSREIGVLFGSLTERILRQQAGESNAFKGFGNTAATNFSPSNPIENNILAPLAINLKSNKDFANRTIVPQSMQDLSPKYQYDETTSEIGKKIGELANLSPKQVDYVINSYTGIIGDLLLPATTKNNKAGVKKAITTQFIADPLYSNQVLTDFYDNYDKYKTIAADKNFTENIPSKTLTREEKVKNSLAKTSKEISALNKQSRIAERAGDMEKVRKLRQKMIELAEKANRNIK